MADTDLDLQRSRAAQNQSLSRSINEQIGEVNAQLADDVVVPQYICECLDVACVELIAIPQHEYLRIRRNPVEFFVVPGHEDLQVEEIVDRDHSWLVVRKLGVGAEVAEDLAEASS